MKTKKISKPIEEPQQIKAYMTNCNVAMLSTKFSNMIDQHTETTKEPILNFEYVLKIDALLFFEYINFLKRIDTDSLIITTKDNKLCMTINKDNALFNSTFEIPLFEGSKLNGIEGFELKSKYSIEYINKFLKNFKKSTLKQQTIVLSLCTDYPIKISVLNDYMILANKINND